MKKLSAKYISLLIALLIGGISASAQVEEYKTEQKERSKTFLIIDSYSEASPWSKSVIMPITYYMANNDSVHAELYHLNSVLITDSVKYSQVHDEFFSHFGDRQIDYVAYIGQMAFTFRDDVKKSWGEDIPMLLITRDLTIANTDYYFSGGENTYSRSGSKTISDIRSDYNFTSVYVPNYYKEVIDMMDSVLGGMDRMVFFTDGAYYNRALTLNVETYLAENYPDVEFEPVCANADDNFILQYYLMHPSEHTGLLLSSWFYEKTGPFGYPILVSGDINLLSSSVNPIFALRHPYMELGAIGGVYYEPTLLHDDIISIVEKMVSGVQPRDMKLCSDGGDPVRMINYPMLKEYELQEKNCPPDTVMVNKPLSFWEKYSWRIITVILIIALCFFLLTRRNMAQRHEIEILSRHKKFIDNMPVPYSKARIKYTPDMKVANISYTIFNQAFDDLKKKNASKGGDYILFPNDFISQKTTELLTTNRPVSFMRHFPATDNYIVFTLCLVEARKKNSIDFVDSIDIFATDVTERQKNERRLRETSQRLDLTINIANIVPWEWDMKTDIMWVKSPELFKYHNDTLTDSLSSDPDKEQWSAVPTADFMRMIVEEDKVEMLHAREQLILNKIDQFHCEYRIKINRHGKERIEWFDVSGAVSERDESGKPIKVIGTLVVVTERKHQENELIEAEEKARNADKMKSAFLANMSHEIRNPLNAIVGFSSLMAETENRDERKEYAELISKNNDLLLNLINDLLDLSKIESNTLDIKKSPTDLNKLMYHVGESIKTGLKPGVVLNMTNGASSCHVNIDSNRITQVMLNLLNNASKFTSEGSITYGYTLQDDGMIHLFVKDTGIGISPENQKRLFKRFDRINSSVPGTGLGLAISKNLIENMGGVAGIYSEGDGKGSTFWFNIPYEPVDTPDEKAHTLPDDAKSSGAATPESTVKSAPAPEKKKNHSDNPLILIAEDIEGNYRLLQNFLNKRYTLEHAWDGEEAVEMYSRLQPDLILMDISMPKLNGYQATEKIRKLDANVPIIAVTAYAYATDRKRILSSGFSDYVVKPISREALIETIEKHLDNNE